MEQYQPSLLIVDDDQDYCALARDYLALYGYRIRLAFDGLMGWQAIEEELPDLLILDIGMPVMDGYELCRRLRAAPATRSLPLIIHSVLDKVNDIVRGFLLQADDYVCKPVDPLIMQLRVEAMLRRTGGRPVEQYPAIVHNAIERACLVPGWPELVLLTEHENNLLAYLLARPCQPVSKEVLMRDVMGYTKDGYQYTSGLRNLVWQLRQKLEPGQKVSRYIRTIPQYGYILVPDGGAITGELVQPDRQALKLWTPISTELGRSMRGGGVKVLL